jgi:hypothetical protein
MAGIENRPPPGEDDGSAHGPSESAPGWWSANWRYVAFSVGGFVVGGVIGAAGGSQSTTTDTATQVVHKVKVVTRTIPKVRTVTETVPSESPSPSEAPPAGSGGSSGGSSQSFSGNGGKTVGNIEVPTDSTLHWTNDGGVFQIFANEYEVLVNSQGHSGSTFLAAGTYSKLQVNAVGNWTINIEAK